MATALLVIDVQKGMFSFPGQQPHDGEGVVTRIATLIARARAARTPVIFVQHAGPPGDPLAPNEPGFSFHAGLTPEKGDNVVVKKNSSAFHGTELHRLLQKTDIDHLVLTGMQSEMCVDSTLRGAVERGYKLTLVADGHSTFDTRQLTGKQIVAHQNETLANFAQVVAAKDVAFP